MGLMSKFRVLTFSKLLLIFVFSTSLATAQNKVQVLDQKLNKPLMGVNIHLTNSHVLAITNEDGEFSLKKLSKLNGNDTLCFSHVGFVTRKFSFSELKLNGYTVSLSEDVQQLREVTVVSEIPSLKHEIEYKQLASMKDGLYAFGSELIGNKIYVIGGDASVDDNEALRALNDYGEDFLKHLKSSINWREFSANMYVYDIQTDKWITDNLKFDKRAYHDIHYFDGKMYVLGGKTLSLDRSTEYLDNNFEVYDLKKNSVLVDHTNPHQAINFASFVYDNNLIVMGGSTRLRANGTKEYSNKAHVCNLKSGYWYELENMPEAKETKGALIGNTIYLIGGFQDVPLKEIETYNVVTGQWNADGKLRYEVDRPGIAYNGNMIYIYEDGKIQTYNIETKESNAYLIDLGLKSAGLFYTNNTLYILGGFQQDEYSVSPSPDLYSVNLDEFKRTETFNKQ